MKRASWKFLILLAALLLGLLSGCTVKDVVTALDLAATANVQNNQAATAVSTTTGPDTAPNPVEMPTRASALTSVPQPVLTESPQGDAIQVYFTNGKGQSNESGVLEERLLVDLQNARTSIDVAMYNFSLRRVADALIAAKQRGVQVRMVTDSDALDGSQFGRLQKAGIKVIGDRLESLMHDKFVVIDQRVVWTGSLNLTGSGTYLDNNNLARFDSADLADNYTTEFEEMFIQDLFGAGSPANTPKPRLEVGGVPLENYFSPDDKVSARIVTLLKGAKQKIDFLSYSFTSDPIGQAMLDRAKGGVKVRGVFDESQYQSNQGSEYLRLKRAGLDVRLDGNPGLMHAKVIIIDGSIVIFGSYNFTGNAERANDENVVVLRSAELGQQFEAEFGKIYQEAQK